jgi:uncharacterized membrane protein
MSWYNAVHIGLLTLIWVVITINFRAIVSERYHWMLFFAVYTTTELVSIPISLYYGNNLWLYGLSRPIQFLLVLIYLLRQINLSLRWKWLLIVICAMAGILLAFYKPMDQYNSLEEVVFGAIITFTSALYFNRFILSDDPAALHKTEFWYVASLFVFYGTSLSVNGSIEYLLKTDRDLATRLFYLLIIESYVLYAMTSFALLASYPLKKSRRW